jgi:membrane protein involved in colicin uptake
MNKKAVDDLRAKQAAEKAAADAARAAEMARYNITSDSDFGGGTPGGGGGNVRTTGGDVYGGATRGGYNEAAEKTDYYRDGGLATMFKNKR